MTDNLPFLSYGRQSIDEDDISAVTAALRSDFLTTGPALVTFEAALAKYTGAAHVIACSSGTAALHMAALALGLRPGDWVVVPAITFLATANAVRFTGADVIFCDVDPMTGLMTARTFEAALAANPNKRVSAVIPVHLAGQPADPVGISAIAKRQNIIVIEDACHSLGTTYSVDASTAIVGGCTQASMATFSFHPVKTITSGEGGAVTTNDPELANRLKLARNHGITRISADFANHDRAFNQLGDANPWYYEMAELGYNYRLSDIHASLVMSQLKKLDRFTDARRRVVNRYDERLSDLAPTIRPLNRIPDCNVAWHLYPVLIDFNAVGIQRAEIINELHAQGIGTQVHYIPVPSQPYYRNLYGEQSLPGAEAFYARTLSLPLFPSMTDDDVERVITALKTIIKSSA